jgi:alcohol dehydrogenase class IV
MVFTIHSPPKIVFGQPAGEALQAELKVVSARRILLISDPILAELAWVRRIRTELEIADCDVVYFTNVSSNPTTDEVAQALELARSDESQAVVALGGGSVIELAKAVAMLLTNGGSYEDYLHDGRPIEWRSQYLVAIPSTAGPGSEVSQSTFIVDPSCPVRRAVQSPQMFAHTALIDPELTRSLPPAITAATGMSAFGQALEAYVGQGATPFTDPWAVTAIQTAWACLPRAVSTGDDMIARQAMMLAALLGGIVRDQAGTGLIDALSGPLTTHLHLHTGLVNALLLPHVLRFNLPAIPPGRRQRLNHILGLASDAGEEEMVERIMQFVYYLGLPTQLSDLSISLADYDWQAMAHEAAQADSIASNPKPVSSDDCQTILAGLR